MIIIGVDFHPEFQQIASVDTDRLTRAVMSLFGQMPMVLSISHDTF